MKKISLTSVALVALYALTPVVAMAQGVNTVPIKGYSDSIISIINTMLLPVLIAIAFIVFLYGVYGYFIKGAAEAESREKGRDFVMWGIIGFVIIFSIWGLVKMVGSTLGLNFLETTPAPPTFKIP